MDALFREFGIAHTEGVGAKLAATLSPEAPPGDPQRLYNIWNSANHHDAKSVIKRKLLANAPPTGLPNEEIQGWVDVYHAYWKAAGEVISAEKSGSKTKVSIR